MSTGLCSLVEHGQLYLQLSLLNCSITISCHLNAHSLSLMSNELTLHFVHLQWLPAPTFILNYSVVVRPTVLSGLGHTKTADFNTVCYSVCRI